MDTSQLQKDFVPVVKSCLTEKYIDFKGRTGQHEFAIFMIFAFVVSIVIYAISGTLGMLVSLALLVPSLAIVVRRLHDIDMPEILAILLFIPFVNLAFIIYIGIQPTKA